MLFKSISLAFVLLFAVFLVGCFPAIVKQECGMENCHGLDIVCGKNIPEVCAQMYQLGDKCRQYVKCEFVNGQCSLVRDHRFEPCKACVQNCAEQNKDNPINVFDCEARCS